MVCLLFRILGKIDAILGKSAKILGRNFGKMCHGFVRNCCHWLKFTDVGKSPVDVGNAERSLGLTVLVEKGSQTRHAKIDQSFV